MADTYAQAISMMAGWIPFLAETEAGLQAKMDKQGGEAPAAPPLPAAPLPAAPASPPSPSRPAALPVTAPPLPTDEWDDDTFDDWAEDMTLDGDQPAAEEGDDNDLFGDEPALAGGESEDDTGRDDDNDLLAELDLPAPAPRLTRDAPPPASKKAAPDDDEDDWLAAIKQ